MQGSSMSWVQRDSRTSAELVDGDACNQKEERFPLEDVEVPSQHPAHEQGNDQDLHAFVHALSTALIAAAKSG